MNITDAIELPEGLRAEFEVIDFEVGAADKTWLLRDVASGTKYVLRPSTVAIRSTLRATREKAGLAPAFFFVALSLKPPSARGVQTFAGRQSRYSHGTEARSVTTGNACGLSRLAVPLLPGPQLQGDPDRRVTALHEVT